MKSDRLHNFPPLCAENATNTVPLYRTLALSLQYIPFSDTLRNKFLNHVPGTQAGSVSGGLRAPRARCGHRMCLPVALSGGNLRHCQRPTFLIAVGSVFDLFFLQ